ncbi:MAG: NAD(+)/NADH kinase [Desulfovibrionaceae bacterium]
MKRNIETMHIITKAGDVQAAALGREIARWLDERGVAAHVQENRTEYGEEDLACKPGADLILVLGGDGTMLSVARRAAGSATPLLGLKQGNLGFLTEICSDDWREKLARCLKGGWTVSRRAVLEYAVMRNGRQAATGIAVNDLVINRGIMARLISLELWVSRDGERQALGSVRADGIIVSTPTGATGYSVSAGGPLIHPGLAAISITPVCPFLHTVPPLVAPDDVEVCLVVNEGCTEVYLTADGQQGEPLRPGDRVTVRRAARDFRMALLDETYFGKLRTKGFLNDCGKGGIDEA